MHADGVEGTTQIQKLRAVQTECFYGCSARCGTPDEDHVILAPGKMSGPALTPRIEKRYDTSCLWISIVGFVVLMTIAGRARPDEFRQGVACTAYTWQDMLADKRCTRVTGRMLTVFTTIASTRAYLLPHSPGDGSTRHPYRSPSRLLP